MNKNFEICRAKKEDLPKCAKILREIYNNNELSEGWTEVSSMAICEFCFKLNPDLFFVAKKHEGREIVGFTYSYIKPWSDGNQLMTEELSVKKEYRRLGIASELLKKVLETAKKKYHVTCLNGETYNGKNGMPFSWYKRIGFEKVDDLFLISGKTDVLLKNLEESFEKNK